ncbi:hypothetical protein [Ruegeria jejuensis]|uniref:hypothetical protein n=1 Tax=Ruegeria jejuensis TaxID=3233338 RepID=UPI00355B18D8
MSHARHTQSHRFVVIYRCEPREIAGAAEVWRGWVERIPDPRQRAEAGQTEERLGFHELQELPALITRLMDEATAHDRRTRP